MAVGHVQQRLEGGAVRPGQHVVDAQAPAPAGELGLVGVEGREVARADQRRRQRHPDAGLQVLEAPPPEAPGRELEGQLLRVHHLHQHRVVPGGPQQAERVEQRRQRLEAVGEGGDQAAPPQPGRQPGQRPADGVPRGVGRGRGGRGRGRLLQQREHPVGVGPAQRRRDV